MGAAENDGGKGGFAADEEDAGALGGVHLVAGEAEEIDLSVRAFWGEIEGELGGGLDGVGMEEGSGGVGDGGKLRGWAG